MNRRFLAIIGLALVAGLLALALQRRMTASGAPPAPSGGVPILQAAVSGATLTAVPITHSIATTRPVVTVTHPVPTVTSTPVAQTAAVPAAEFASVSHEISVQGAPRLSAAMLHAILLRAQSPLAAEATYIEQDGERWQIDPAILATVSLLVDTAAPLPTSLHNVGHLRAIVGAPAADGYRRFSSWNAGIDAWYKLIHDVYVVGWHRTTLEAILPVYAANAGPPAEQRRRIESLINQARMMLMAWRLQDNSGKVAAQSALAHTTVAG